MLAGAYGGHSLPKNKSPYFKGIYETANRYHLVHSALIALAPAACSRPHLVGSLFAGGTALFCSSQYALGVTENRATRIRKVGPIGATMLVGGWLALALG